MVAQTFNANSGQRQVDLRKGEFSVFGPFPSCSTPGLSAGSQVLRGSVWGFGHHL